MKSKIHFVTKFRLRLLAQISSNSYKQPSMISRKIRTLPNKLLRILRQISVEEEKSTTQVIRGMFSRFAAACMHL